MFTPPPPPPPPTASTRAAAVPGNVNVPASSAVNFSRRSVPTWLTSAAPV